MALKVTRDASAGSSVPVLHGHPIERESCCKALIDAATTSVIDQPSDNTHSV